MEREPRIAAVKVALPWRRSLHNGGLEAFDFRLSSSLLRRGLRSGKVLRRIEGGLRNGEPITLCDAAFLSFHLLLCFSVF